MNSTPVKNRFTDTMTGIQRSLGLVYLPMHYFILPILVSMLGSYVQKPISNAAANLIYYAPGFVLCFTVMYSYLRTGFDILLDKKLFMLLSYFYTFCIYMMLSFVTSFLLLLILRDSLANPNNVTVQKMIFAEGTGPYLAIAVLIAPIVEEVLFRGVVFGGIRKKSRWAAFTVSIVLFSFYHVWQYLLIEMDPIVLVYMIQYIPAGFALALCYEQTNCIWMSILFHMTVNLQSILALA